MSKENNPKSKMSDSFQAAEENREAAVEDKRVEEENKELVVFFHYAEKGQLGGRAIGTQLVGGKNVERDNPLRFDENLYVTSDPKEIAFIEGHDSFNVHCFRCKDMNDAIQRRNTHSLMKQERTVTVDLNMRADGVDVITAE